MTIILISYLIESEASSGENTAISRADFQFLFTWSPKSNEEALSKWVTITAEDARFLWWKIYR